MIEYNLHYFNHVIFNYINPKRLLIRHKQNYIGSKFYNRSKEEKFRISFLLYQMSNVTHIFVRIWVYLVLPWRIDEIETTWVGDMNLPMSSIVCKCQNLE